MLPPLLSAGVLCGNACCNVRPKASAKAVWVTETESGGVTESGAATETGAGSKSDPGTESAAARGSAAASAICCTLSQGIG